jgi:hypothetical protein
MNWFGPMTIALGFGGYFIGSYLARKIISRRWALVLAAILVVLAIPAAVYDLYYFKILGEPIWLYRLRSVPGSELLASLCGLFAGWIQVRMAPRLKLSPLGKRFLVPVVLAFGLALPYLKPLLRPVPSSTLRDEWNGKACLQSTASTCGPASVATIVHSLGGHLRESDLTREAFTSGRGTENWYLARALRRHGWRTNFLLSDPGSVPLPAVAGVRLKSLGNSGHFIALLERHGDEFVLADPMEGLSTNTLSGMYSVYDFTGFFMTIRPGRSGPD